MIDLRVAEFQNLSRVDLPNGINPKEQISPSPLANENLDKNCFDTGDISQFYLFCVVFIKKCGNIGKVIDFGKAGGNIMNDNILKNTLENSLKNNNIVKVFGCLLFVTFLFGFALTYHLHAQEEARVHSKVLSIDGSVTVKYNKADLWIMLKENTNITKGDQIKTKSNSMVNLELPDGSIVKIGSESHIVVKNMGMVEITKLSENKFYLFYGKIRAVVAPFIHKDSKFEIETENATIGVRGTDFGVYYDFDTAKTELFCIEGELSMKHKIVKMRSFGDGGDMEKVEPISIGANRTMSIETGVKPGKPAELSKERAEKFNDTMGFTNKGVRDKANSIKGLKGKKKIDSMNSEKKNKNTKGRKNNRDMNHNTGKIRGGKSPEGGGAAGGGAGGGGAP